MKIRFLNFSVVLSIVILFLSCSQEKNDYFDYTDAPSVKVASKTGFVNLIKLSEEVVNIDFSKNSQTGFSNVKVFVSYTPHTSITELASVTGETGTFSITIPNLLTKLNVNQNDVKVGETLRFYFDMAQNDGKVIRDRDVVTLPFSCPSALAGVYTSLTSGSSTDGCCPNPEVDFPGEVTLTKLSDGRYQISDFSAGLYFKWYEVYGITSVNQSPGKLLDVCGNLSFYDTQEPFATAITGTGSVDSGTGVITYSWENGYGDKGTVKLTPK